MIFCIDFALAARAACAVAARLSTPAVIAARSGTAATAPVPETVTVSRGDRVVDGLRAFRAQNSGEGGGREEQAGHDGDALHSKFLLVVITGELRRRDVSLSHPVQGDASLLSRCVAVGLERRAEALARGGDRLTGAARAGCRPRGDALGGRADRAERAVAHRGGNLLVRLAERDAAAHEILGDVGRQQQRIRDRGREALAVRRRGR